MKFFIDTANLDEIREAASMGLLDGVTTNPSLVAKTGRKFEAVIADICEIVDGPVSAETISEAWDGMVAEGRELAKIHPNVVIKVPLTIEGLKACKALRSEGIGVNVTLCFSPSQALMAAKAGATFISPFIGRLDDISQVGMELIEQIVTIYNNYSFDTEVLVASVRHPVHVVEAALIGADIVTIPFNVLAKLVKHPLTDIGNAQFLADAAKIPR
jgi:transaldolase